MKRKHDRQTENFRQYLKYMNMLGFKKVTKMLILIKRN